MFTRSFCLTRSKVSVTILITLGWLFLMLCWMAFGWGHYSLLQNLASLGISTLLFGAITGVLWVKDLGFVPAATILTTLGWLSLALYWTAFVWSRYTLLQNGAVLVVSCLVWQTAVAVFWLAGPLNTPNSSRLS
jgi:hypothetical protein